MPAGGRGRQRGDGGGIAAAGCRVGGRLTRVRGQARGRAGSALAEQRVEKPVLIVRCARERRQELSALPHYLDGKGEGFAQRVGVAGAEGIDLCFVLRVKDRARGVKEESAVCEARPKGVQDACLLFAESCDIARPAKPFAIGMAPHDTRGRAWHIDEDPLERPAVPPRGGRARIAGDHAHAARVML